MQEKQRGTHLKFQSTHPLRGATASPKSAHIRHLHFNPHFNPRTPCGVRPRGILRDAAIPDISIHAPLAGCDDGICAAQEVGKDFNPRTPCGVRRRRTRQQGNGYQFQSTHPLRGATSRFHDHHWHIYISIHAPLAGCDADERANKAMAINFNPRTPCGVRLVETLQSYTEISISIHAPLAGCDTPYHVRGRGHHDFNPRTPCGVRLNTRSRC